MPLLCCASRPFVVRCQAQQEKTKLVTFLGKGGVGKTTCAVTAARFYASLGFHTCLVVQSLDSTPDFLLGEKLRYLPVSFCDGSLTAMRAESTKSGGAAREKVAGEELSVLPGMASIMELFLLEQLSGFARRASKRSSGLSKPKYDVVVYDGPDSAETVRIFGSAERARWYMNRFRSIVEKTDVGRVTMPSILRLIETSITDNSSAEGSSAQLWDEASAVLEGIVERFSDPETFSGYIVTDPNSRIAEQMALRYWGSSMQAGMHIGGFLHHRSKDNDDGVWKQKYSPSQVAAIPKITFDTTPDWKTVLNELSEETQSVLKGGDQSSSSKPVSIDPLSKTVTCFLPGFEKSEIKLSQLKNSELLLEAGDQRRVIRLPDSMQGKVAGAKFQDNGLVIKLKAV